MENQNVNINEMSSEDLGLLLIEQYNQLANVQNNIQAIRNLLIDRKPKTQIISPKENNDGNNGTMS
jgi:hypothetical protein